MPSDPKLDPARASVPIVDPLLPGLAPHCIAEGERLDAVEAVLDKLVHKLGDEPSKVEGTTGTGLVGLVMRGTAKTEDLVVAIGKLGEQQERMNQRLDNLTRSNSQPPGKQASGAQKVAMGIGLVLIILQQIPTTYFALRGAPVPSIVAPKVLPP